ncbi:efflux RND transporter periplasmic adaptor subunit [Pelomonas sp. CA6]|uniref:efflux RND transporter periplasmic adaptor subunit n=1 Tax=Pelomonas sp. CA6 TaxID=2907999 RepID=UPI001F4A27C4|nr:efflux RND transporter periplasmic adaptor subunit [Pelomonas sp. CA6]MCH7342217.1 efflux RND transporter periplasmic adaptor subunit [Pelomonas sp. CA6]
MSFKKPQTLIALVALAGAVGLAYWWQNKPPAAASPSAAAAPAGKPAAGAGGGGGPVPVEVRKVVAQDLAEEAQAVGTLRARQSVLLKPEVSGRVVKLGFADGQRVRAGQLLVQLDDSLQAAQLKQAEAQASLARTQLQRNRELLSQGFVSANAVDQSQSALEVAEAQVALSRAQVQRMQVRAPFDGVAGIRAVNLGDYVKDGADLVSVEDASTMWVDFRLPERHVPALKKGQPVELSLDVLPGRQFRARVEALDALLDANGRSLLVRAQLEQPGPELRTGLFARVRVRFAARQNALLVPEEALVPQAGKQYLLKVVQREGKPAVQRLEARTGQRLPGRVEILDGLTAGDTVVTAGHARLMRGDPLPIKIVDLDQVAQGGGASASHGAAPAAPAAQR